MTLHHLFLSALIVSGIAPIRAAEKGPGPWTDPADAGVWPNQTSRANGDAWLVRNHDRITQMRPRLLVINFSNAHDRGHLDRLLANIMHALGESSRYHGYADAEAPVFLQYEVFKFVDLRDDDRTEGDSRLVPVKDVAATEGFNMKLDDRGLADWQRHRRQGRGQAIHQRGIRTVPGVGPGLHGSVADLLEAKHARTE